VHPAICPVDLDFHGCSRQVRQQVPNLQGAPAPTQTHSRNREQHALAPDRQNLAVGSRHQERHALLSLGLLAGLLLRPVVRT
jgi:hypothetical protein